MGAPCAFYSSLEGFPEKGQDKDSEVFPWAWHYMESSHSGHGQGQYSRPLCSATSLLYLELWKYMECSCKKKKKGFRPLDPTLSLSSGWHEPLMGGAPYLSSAPVPAWAPSSDLPGPSMGTVVMHLPE